MKKTKNGFREKYSLGALRDLYRTLYINQQNVSLHNQEVLVETVRAIAEVIVYADQHLDQLFEYFCEKNIFTLMINLLSNEKCSSRLSVQIIQSVGILIQNIKTETS